MHRQRVHDPRHDLGVGVDVGRRDVAVGTDEDRDLGGEAPGHVLQLLAAEPARVDDDAALGAPVRDVDDGALPGHPHGQRLDLVQRDVRVEADAALRRSAVDAVLDAVAGEDLDAAVVHLDREVAGELALDLAQDLPELRLQPDDLGRGVELALCGAPLVSLLVDLHRRAHLTIALTSTPRTVGTPRRGRTGR